MDNIYAMEENIKLKHLSLVAEEKTPDIICASFAHRYLLDYAVHELTNQGFIAKNLFLFKAAKDHETNKSYLLDHVLIHATMTAEGALLGVVIGAIAGALLTWVGLVGPFGSASTMVMLVVNLITCAFVGSIAGGLIGLAVPEYKKSHYKYPLKAGDFILTVKIKSEDEAQKARSIIEAHQGKEIIPTIGIKKAS